MTIAINFIRNAGDTLTIDWSDGQVSELDSMWLRDHCQMPVSRDPNNGQRLLNVTDIPEDITIGVARRIGTDQIEVVFLPENHTSVFSTEWLRENCYCINSAFDDRSADRKTLWQHDSFSAGLPTFNYPAFASDPATRTAALEAFSEYGFALLTDVPCTPGQVLDVIRQNGFVRNTNYGELFEVKTVPNPNNLAFSNLGLGCHTDNPYRDPVPTVQFLHCLVNSATGGDSVLVDGFMAADVLRKEDPDDFSILVGNWVNFRFSDAVADLRSRVPMIEINDLGNVVRVRYNNRSIATLNLPRDNVKRYYRAYRHFADILERASLKIAFRLQPGHLVMFDNTRLMHARTAISEDGARHLQGAYTDLDGLYSALNVLRRSD